MKNGKSWIKSTPTIPYCNFNSNANKNGEETEYKLHHGRRDQFVREIEKMKLILPISCRPVKSSKTTTSNSSIISTLFHRIVDVMFVDVVVGVDAAAAGDLIFFSLNSKEETKILLTHDSVSISLGATLIETKYICLYL